MKKRVTFTFSDIAVALIIAAVSLATFIIAKNYENNNPGNIWIDIVILISSTGLSIATLDLLLELSSIKKLITQSQVDANKAILGEMYSKDLSIYSNDQIEDISRKIGALRITDQDESIACTKLDCYIATNNAMQKLLNDRSVLQHVQHDVFLNLDGKEQLSIITRSSWTALCNSGVQTFSYFLWYPSRETRDRASIKYFKVNNVKQTVTMKKLEDFDKASDPYGIEIYSEFFVNSTSYKLEYQYEGQALNNTGVPGGFLLKDFAYGMSITVVLNTVLNGYVPYLYTMSSLSTNKQKTEVHSSGLGNMGIKFVIDDWCYPGTGCYYGCKKKVLDILSENNEAS